MWDLLLTFCYLQESRGRLNEIVNIYSLTRGAYATRVSRSHLPSVRPLVGPGSSNAGHQNGEEEPRLSPLHSHGLDRWETEAQGREVTCTRSHTMLGSG